MCVIPRRQSKKSDNDILFRFFAQWNSQSREEIAPGLRYPQAELAVPEGINDWIEDGVDHADHECDFLPQILHFPVECLHDQLANSGLT